MKDGFWIAVIVLIFSLSCALAWAVMDESDEEAVISVDGEEVYRILLSEDRVIELECGNTVEIKDGRVRVSEADCPDLVCVGTGWIEDGSSAIVCLPHKLSVTVDGAEGDTDISIK
ncbi:MAG: NusG domain II-containing protein [Clostridia bacterium]|nr:NusG domain II-containing protein [Clostridia bacterium]MBQ2327478.1 NusG domain II-containing protein [Clostridia bacterium]MBQ5813324.1 NusG domain II-containing protein [Clostridia bacterium]